MRLLLFGNHSTGDGYPRLRVLAEGLRAHGIEVVERRVPFLEEEGRRVRAAGSAAGFLAAGLRAAAGLLRLWRAYGKAGPHDAVLVGHPGQIAVRVARRRAPRGVPVLLDAFLSLHDTAVNDRGLLPEGSLRARLLRGLDRGACRAADLVLVDTAAHGRFFRESLGVPEGKIRVVPVGSPGRPLPAPGRPPGEGPLEVLWFGTYVPLQGAGVVLEAAARLRGEPIRFTMVGRGQDLSAARERARALGLGEPALEVVEAFVPREELERRMAAADVCLGIFGTTDKAARVVPCKVYDALAAGRPLVTAGTPAAREILEDGVHALLVPPGDPEALATALRRLRADPDLRARLAEGARRLQAGPLAPPLLVAALARELLGGRREEERWPAPPRTD